MGFPGADQYTAADFALHIGIVGRLSFCRLRAAAQKISVPVVVTYVLDDRLVEPTIGAELASTFDTKPLTFDSGGHNMQKTRAADIAGPLARICDQTSSERKEAKRVGPE